MLLDLVSWVARSVHGFELPCLALPCLALPCFLAISLCLPRPPRPPIYLFLWRKKRRFDGYERASESCTQHGSNNESVCDGDRDWRLATLHLHHDLGVTRNWDAINKGTSPGGVPRHDAGCAAVWDARLVSRTRLS